MDSAEIHKYIYIYVDSANIYIYIYSLLAIPLWLFPIGTALLRSWFASFALPSEAPCQKLVRSTVRTWYAALYVFTAEQSAKKWFTETQTASTHSLCVWNFHSKALIVISCV